MENLAFKTPENLRQMIEHQIARVSSDERNVLEAASVVGAEFSAAAVAAGMEQEPEAVEEYCGALVRREQFLRERGMAEWPDGTVAARYGFVHALYQEVLYERLAVSQRTRLHRQIGEREEVGYGERAREIAAELAVHFERGRDYRRAVQYRKRAGETAIQRNANQEAIAHLTRGLELLQTLPDTPERVQQELAFQLALGTPLLAMKGYAAPEVEHAYDRAKELCQQVGETGRLFHALFGLFMYYAMRAEHKTAREIAEQAFRVAQQAQDPDLLPEAYYAQGNTLSWIGEFASARTYLEQGITLHDPQKHGTHAFRYGHDPGVGCRVHSMQVSWLLGYPDHALKRGQEALSLAEGLSHFNTLMYALTCLAMCHQLRREWPVAQEFAEKTIALSTEQGFPYWVAQASIILGSALAGQGQHQEGIAKMRQGLDFQRAIGGRIL